MADLQVIDFVKTAATAIIVGVLALVGVYLTNRFDAEKRRKEMLRERAEELYVLNEELLKGLLVYFMRRSSVMQGKLTYDQILDLEIAEGKQSSHDFSRIEMLTYVYFPSTRPAYDRLTVGRNTLSDVASQHKQAYETGDLDGRRFCQPFLQAMQDIESAGKSMKEAILKDLRAI